MKRRNKKMTLWSNYDLDLDDWRDDLKEMYPDVKDEDELYNLMIEINESYLEDVISELDHEVPCGILVLATLGLWDGKHTAYTEISSCNLKDCMKFREDYTEWFVDSNEDLWGVATHHDGTNRYLYRAYKEGVSETQKDNLKFKIYSGTVTPADISRLTRRLGPDVLSIYGVA